MALAVEHSVTDEQGGATPVADPPIVAPEENLNAALIACAERALLLLRAEGTAIALSDGSSLVCRAAAGAFAPDIGVPVNANTGLTGECVRTRRMIACPDATQDVRVSESAAAAGIGAALLAPVMRDDAVLGVIEAFWSAPRVFNDTDQRALELIARQLGRILQEQHPVVSPVPEPHSRENLAAVARAAEPVPKFLDMTTSSEPRLSRRVLVAVAAVVLAVGALLIGHRIASVPEPAPVSENSETNQRHLELIKQQAEQGNVGAQSILALFYWTGRGVKQDNESAYMWSAIAAAQGDANSKERLELLRAAMSPEMVSRAEERKTKWMKEHSPTSRQ
jgi:GAF domain-containing protein